MSARDELIGAGLLRPCDAEPYPPSVARTIPPGFERGPVLRMDGQGRRVAAWRLSNPDRSNRPITIWVHSPDARERYLAPRAIGRAA
jgi:hypothetical protein